AVHYPDSVIAGILNRQGRTTAYGHRFTAGRVGNLRRHWDIPCFEPPSGAPEGELLTIKKAAVALGVAPSTIHRLLNDGIIAGEQMTPGAPWRIRLTDDPRARFNSEAGDTSCQCGKRSARLACRARPYCSVSSAANAMQSTSCAANKRG